MTPGTIAANVLAHVAYGRDQHPTLRNREEWVEVLATWFDLATNGLDGLGAVLGPENTSKRLAQLAGLCVRAIEELDLPLVPPPARADE
jgi:hypothetical protein